MAMVISDSKSKSKSTAICGLFTLPPEIIEYLFLFIPSPHTALQIALCSKACYALALPALYAHINWLLSPTRPGDASIRGHALLASKPYLFHSVKSFRLTERPSKPETDHDINWHFISEDQPRQPLTFAGMGSGMGFLPLSRRLIAQLQPQPPRLVKDPQFKKLTIISKSMMSTISLCSNINELTFRGVTLPKDFYSVIHSFRNLRTVTIRSCTLPCGTYPKHLNPSNLKITNLTILQMQSPSQRISPRKLKILLRLARSPHLHTLQIDRSVEIALDSLSVYGIPNSLKVLICDFRGFSPRGRKALQAIWNFFSKCYSVEELRITDISGVKTGFIAGAGAGVGGNGGGVGHANVHPVENTHWGLIDFDAEIEGLIPEELLAIAPHNHNNHNPNLQVPNHPIAHLPHLPLPTTIAGTPLLPPNPLPRSALPNLQTLICPLEFVNIFCFGRPVRWLKIVSTSMPPSRPSNSNLGSGMGTSSGTRASVSRSIRMANSGRFGYSHMVPVARAANRIGTASNSSNTDNGHVHSQTRSQTQIHSAQAPEQPEAQFLTNSLAELSSSLIGLRFVLPTPAPAHAAFNPSPFTGLQRIELNIKEFDREVIYMLSGLVGGRLRDLRVVWSDDGNGNSNGKNGEAKGKGVGDDFYMTLGNIIEFPCLETLHLYNANLRMGHLIRDDKVKNTDGKNDNENINGDDDSLSPSSSISSTSTIASRSSQGRSTVASSSSSTSIPCSFSSYKRPAYIPSIDYHDSFIYDANANTNDGDISDYFDDTFIDGLVGDDFVFADMPLSSIKEMEAENGASSGSASGEEEGDVREEDVPEEDVPEEDEVEEGNGIYGRRDHDAVRQVERIMAQVNAEARLAYRDEHGNDSGSSSSSSERRGREMHQFPRQGQEENESAAAAATTISRETVVDHAEYMLIWQRFMPGLREVALACDVVWYRVPADGELCVDVAESERVVDGNAGERKGKVNGKGKGKGKEKARTKVQWKWENKVVERMIGVQGLMTL